MGKLSVLWSLKSVLAWLCWGLWFNDVRPGILLQCNDHQMVQSSLVANGMLNSFISTRLDRRHLLTCGKFFTLFNSRTVFQLFGSKTWWGLNLFHFAFLWVPFCLGIPDVFKGVTIHFFCSAMDKQVWRLLFGSRRFSLRVCEKLGLKLGREWEGAHADFLMVPLATRVYHL